MKKGDNAVPQWLIKWTHLPEDSATCEDGNVISKRFPDAPAWGQAGSTAGGVVIAEGQVQPESTPVVAEDVK